MPPIRFLGSRRRMLLVFAGVAFFALSTHFLATSDREEIKSRIQQHIKQIPLPSWIKSSDDTLENTGLAGAYEAYDKHPISIQIAEAEKRWRDYDNSRSKTFQEAVSKYRHKYGRHPPPGFDIWYKFAREREVHNIDDFEQVMDDLRPFWGVPPATIRALAARMWEGEGDGISGIHIRNHEIAKISQPGWRADTMAAMIQVFIKHLPDMDVAMNSLDQPRVTVPWYDMQTLLTKEIESRQLLPEARNSFSEKLPGLYDINGDPPTEPREDAGWYTAAGKQYMDIAKKACPPKSHANDGQPAIESERTWKSRDGGVVTNFNLSTDLCTIGPEIQDKHGLLFTASSIVNSERLVPVFGECKVNVNSDILFPANMYWRQDERYEYDGKHDINWDNKTENIVWRGVTSGGVQLPDNWKRMHRQRLVMALNATLQANKNDVRIMAEQPEAKGDYENFRSFRPSTLLKKISDVGFTEEWGCFPEDCNFYWDWFTLKPQMSLGEQFKSKYLIDVDGHSFSGRWRAFLQSKGLGIKATIFREWHDSRLFAWKHFVPLDNRYDDIYTILTYFTGIGEGNPSERLPDEPFVHRHDIEGKRLALQGREWASKVLRTEDIEIYMFRLLLEYARIIDDNRDVIGYSGDGSELASFDAKFHYP